MKHPRRASPFFVLKVEELTREPFQVSCPLFHTHLQSIVAFPQSKLGSHSSAIEMIDESSGKEKRTKVAEIVGS
jgi:hypothetical protein